MTSGEARRAFYMELDKREISAAPSFLNDEAVYFLNAAYIALIRQKFSGDNKLQQGFDASQLRVSDLRPLIKRENVNLVTKPSLITNEIQFQLPSDMLFFIGAGVKGSSAYTSLKMIRHGEAEMFQVTDINKPWIPVPVAFILSDTLVVYIDPLASSSEMKCAVTYIKYPNQISLTNDNQAIEVNWADEIVSLAVDYALDNIEAQRVQSHSQITQNKE